MSTSDETYAPRSPDLSSFYSSGPTQSQANGQNPSLNQSQQGPFFPGHQFQYSNQLHQAQALQPPQLYYPSHSIPGGSGSLPHSQSQSLPHHQPHNLAPTAPYSSHNPTVQAQQYSPTKGPQGAGHQQPYGGQAGYNVQAQQPLQNYPTPYGNGQYEPQFAPQPFPQPALQQHPATFARSDTQPQSEFQQAETMPPRRSAAQAARESQASPSPVRTKFPTARIKRIMQADEEVGKVAQQTPIAVGKALELFMVALVTKSADVARERNSKRVSAQMLKHVVESDDQWDFLREIVGKVENDDKPNRGGRVKAESESEEEEAAERKKSRAGRKKKAA
ncbi:hypothetical protein VTK73DRAFT_9761 [Phialemonium thermophilum]|uniref:Transcription factor CBF/NF-Y/archaeal histone domain-containing protein n=1 Tax=Phialemonium thermophilum TaxID=223376 RepID=A0ABR3XJI4_9PEZI